MKKLLSIFIATLCAFGTTCAEINWLPTSSFHTGSGGAFLSLGNGTGTTSATPAAFGGGVNSDGTFVFSLANTTPAGMPALAETELSSTVLPLGTRVVLVFSKDASDRINYIAALGDGASLLNYQVINDTSFSVTATITDPVESASGDVAAAFGLVVNYQDDDSLDYKGSMFITDMHFLDLDVLANPLEGMAGIRADGASGVTASFTAFLPLSFLSSVDLLNVPESCEGRIDGTLVDGSQFVNAGLRTDLGFDFNDSTNNPQNQVLQVSLINSDWSAHDIQFGLLAENSNAPVVTLIGKAKRTVKGKKLKLKGKVTDDDKIVRVEASVDGGAYKKAKLNKKKGKWNYTVRNLKRGKTKTVLIRAIDSDGNISTLITVEVTRKAKKKKKK